MVNGWSAAEISPEELVRAIENHERIQIVDIRSPEKAASGSVDPPSPADFHNIPGSRLRSMESLEGTGIDPALPTAVVCSHGNDSKIIAQHLRDLGCPARSLSGGMAAWMALSYPREIDPPAGLDRLVQFDRLGKGALGYLLISADQALIIDPPRNAEPFLTLLRQSGARPVAVADTHVHADYISGGPAIARMLGVPYCLHPADAIFPYDRTPGRVEYRPVNDGDEIPFGNCVAHVMHTPGHTEGSLTYLIGKDAAFTGDFLFVAAVGRPDLAGKTQEWAALLWKSMQAAKQHWAPAMMVYPAHYASSAERRADRSVAIPFGALVEQIEPLRMTNESEFAAWVNTGVRRFPEAYKKIKAVNVGLAEVSEKEATELEAGKNECALAGGHS